jgi:hypothetical protein
LWPGGEIGIGPVGAAVNKACLSVISARAMRQSYCATTPRSPSAPKSGSSIAE